MVNTRHDLFHHIKRQGAKRYVTLLQSPTKVHQTFNERTVRAFKSSHVKNHNFSPAYDRKRSFFCVETLLPFFDQLRVSKLVSSLQVGHSLLHYITSLPCTRAGVEFL